MPAKRGSAPVQAAKRAVRRRKLVAKVVVEGKQLTQAARETGVSRGFASHEINSPATRVLIDEVVDRHAEEIGELVGLGLAAIRDCVTPTHRVLLKPRKGEKKRRILEIPNEPRVRLIAAKRVIEIALAGRRAEQPKGGNQTFTWQQFLTIYNDPQRLEAAAS